MLVRLLASPYTFAILAGYLLSTPFAVRDQLTVHNVPGVSIYI